MNTATKILAQALIGNANTSRQAVRPISRACFSICSDTQMVAIQVSSGAIELYWIDPADGLEMFQGYISDINIPATTRIRAVEALCSPGRELFPNR